jgi:predicted S18 family serine protease
MLNLIPSTIIGYTGQDDYFDLLSVFDKLVTNAMFNIQKRRLARILLEYGVTDKLDKLYQSITNIQRLNQKLAFGELYDERVIFLKEEIEFLRRLMDLEVRSEKKQVAYLVKETKNNKITDYI